MSFRVVCMAAALATATAREVGSGELRVSKRLRSKLPHQLAFQVGETVYELTPEKLAAGKPYLLQFTGKGDDYCKQMEPLKAQLKDEYGIEIRCFEVWYTPANLKLLQKLDRGRCGGVPFFYNKKTRRFICGATTYGNLKAWALNQPCEPFLPPPSVVNQQKPPNEVRTQVQEWFAQLKAKAEEKMASRRRDS